MKSGTILLIIIVIILVGLISLDIWEESKNPAPKGTTCFMEAEEQEQAYKNYLSFLNLCYYESNYTMEFIGIKQGLLIKHYGYDKCNQEVCCVDFDVDELVYCRNKKTSEVKMFKKTSEKIPNKK